MSKESGDFVGHYHCIGNECSDKHDCHSSDGLAIYQNTNEDGSIASFDKENIREALADIQRVYFARIGYNYMRLVERGDISE